MTPIRCDLTGDAAQAGGLRAQRRLMQKLADRVDRASQSDRRFFERFPHREVFESASTETTRAIEAQLHAAVELRG
jgi:hypothetical protein